MPIQHAIWTVGAQPQPLAPGRLPSEQTLEDMIVRDPRILSNEWMLIGRQVPTRVGRLIDLLAIALGHWPVCQQVLSRRESCRFTD